MNPIQMMAMVSIFGDLSPAQGKHKHTKMFNTTILLPFTTVYSRRNSFNKQINIFFNLL